MWQKFARVDVFGDDKVLDSSLRTSEPGSQVKLWRIEGISDWADRFLTLERFPDNSWYKIFSYRLRVDKICTNRKGTKK